MPLMQKGVKMLADRMPKVISPKTHAIIDYATAGSFFIAGALLWKRKRRAAIASLLCGAMEAGTAIITDFPGGVTDLISFQTHGRIDAGFAGFVATLPNVFMFGDKPEAMFFRGQGVGIAAVTGLTDFSEGQRNRRYRGRRAA